MHDIWKEKFVAVREPAWHRLGLLVEEDILPSQAYHMIGMDYEQEVESYPLYALVDGRYIPIRLHAIGHMQGEDLEVFGTAKDFEILRIQDMLPNLDEMAKQAKLSASGVLGKGSEVFFSFQIPGDDILGEQYVHYLTVIHSFKPGTAHKVLYTPVRTVCRNTLIIGEETAFDKLSIPHTSDSKARFDAALIISQATVEARRIAARLETLAELRLEKEQVEETLEATYKRYRPAELTGIEDIVSADVVEQYSPRRLSQLRYYQNLYNLGFLTYERFGQEHPEFAGTGYALYQAIVEVADHRKGRGSAAESAVVGVRAAEKAAAWQTLVNFLN